MSPLEHSLQAKLNERRANGNFRKLTTHEGAIDFFSNDYLGLSSTGTLNKLVGDAHATATGSTGSRLISGNSPEAEALETAIAAFHRSEAALLFNSGYDANTGLISAIADRHTTIIYDELCHASIIDGIRLGLCANKYKFNHNDLADLTHKLQKHNGDGPLIVIVESVYSMDGDMAPLTEIAAVCNLHNAKLIVDEAHATGVFGENGRGLVCAQGLEDHVFARVHTFGKALGAHGAAVVGSQLLKDYLINFARPFIYTTALPPHSISTVAAAYAYLSASSFSNQVLHTLITYFRERVAALAIPGLVDSTSPIQAIILGDNKKCTDLATALQSKGILVKAILHPTVPKGKERLRICLHSFNTTAEIDLLLEVIA